MNVSFFLALLIGIHWLIRHTVKAQGGKILGEGGQRRLEEEGRRRLEEGGR